MLKKILIVNQNIKQLSLALIGSIIGIVFLLISIHYLKKIQDFGKSSEMLNENAVVIQKKVTNTNILTISKTTFSENEIQNIKNQPFIEDLSIILNNNFRIIFETNDKAVPYFNSDVYVQSVPSNALDIKFEQWKWNIGDSLVPIVLPQDFLVMLNTFMTSAGMPQISEDIAKAINFRFILYDEFQNKQSFKAKIIGFTNELSSILVPENFIKYGNEKFARNKEMKVSQLLLLSKKKQFGALEQFIKEKQYEPKTTQVVINRLKSTFSILLSCIVFISIIGVFLSILVLIQYIQLLISNKTYEIQTLLRIGYYRQQITRIFMKYFTSLFLIISCISYTTFIILKQSLDHYFINGGIYIDNTFGYETVLVIILLNLTFTVSIFINTKRNINELYK